MSNTLPIAIVDNDLSVRRSLGLCSGRQASLSRRSRPRAYQLVRCREAGVARRRDRHGNLPSPPQRIASIPAVIVE
jgi:hypothetical protein